MKMILEFLHNNNVLIIPALVFDHNILIPAIGDRVYVGPGEWTVEDRAFIYVPGTESTDLKISISCKKPTTDN